MAEQMTRGEMQDLLTCCLNDPEYREALLKDPKGMFEQQLALSLPADVNVRAVEEAVDTIWVVVPHAISPDQELNEADLEQVAGGGRALAIARKRRKCKAGGALSFATVNVFSVG